MISVNKSIRFDEIKLMIPMSTCGITPVKANKTVATLNQKLDLSRYRAYKRKKVELHANTSRLTNITHLFSSKKSNINYPFLFKIKNLKERSQHDHFSQAFLLPWIQKQMLLYVFSRTRLVLDHGTLENHFL